MKNAYSISLDDNFYEIGGDSVLTKRLFDKIGMKYPRFKKYPVKFNACPSIRTLALQLAGKPEIDDSVKWLKGEKKWMEKTGSNKECPVILIHSITGNAEDDYKNFLECWKEREDAKGIPLLCINSPSILHPEFFETSIQKLAKFYLRLLDKKLANYKGPVFFAGYSAGGIIAHEMTKQCQKEGRPAAVYYIDTTSTSYYKFLTQADFANEIHALISYMMKIMGIHLTEPLIALDELSRYAKNEQLAICWRKLMEHVTNRSEDEKKEFLGMYVCMQSQIMAQMNYKTVAVENAGLITFSKTIQEKNADPRLGWSADLPMKIDTVEGEHLSFSEIEKNGLDKETFMTKMMNYILIRRNPNNWRNLLHILKIQENYMT